MVTRSLGVLTVLVSLIGSAFSQDWPQWRGPDRDGKVSGFVAPVTWPQSLTQKWKIAVGSGDSTPALVAGKLYVFSRQGGDEVTRCLDAATGNEIWKDTFAVPPVSGPAARHPGPRSSPAVSDGKVVTLGVSGVLTCLDASTGKVLWRNQEYKGVPRFYTGSSPLIDGDLCVAQLGGPGNGAIVGLELATGNEKWKWTGESAAPGYSSPVLMTVSGVKQVIALTEKSIVGIDMVSGKLFWQQPFEAQGMAYNAATPIVDGQVVTYVGQGRGMKALRIIKDNGAYSGVEAWRNVQTSVQFSSPVLKEGELYAISDKGNLWCVSASTGETIWTDTAKRGGYGAMLDAGSVLIALTEKGEMVVFKPDEKQFTQIAALKVADTNTYAYPVISGKAIYIKDQDSLIMWNLE